MKIWLDDERPAPEGWDLMDDPLTVIGRISLQRELGDIEEISLDHDLGYYAAGVPKEGYMVLEWIERELFTHGLDRIHHVPKLSVHSANPPAHDRMLAAAAAIERRLSSLQR